MAHGNRTAAQALLLVGALRYYVNGTVSRRYRRQAAALQPIFARTLITTMVETQQTLAILFADIAGSTKLYETVGDVEAHRRVAESLAFMAHAVQLHGGSVLRTVGDSTLASFGDCDAALQAASEMQELHKQTPLAVRVGFHFGPVIADKGDVYGNAVNIAARVASFAKPDEITATDTCISQLSDAHRHRANLLDTIQVKGITEPLGVYRLTWEADTALHTRIAPSGSAPLSVNDQASLELSRQGQVHQLTKHSSVLTIGRDNQCTLSVDGDRVSRQHAQLEWSAGQIEISDTSTNGTYIHRVGEAPLFVRRETIVLKGRGSIGLGCLPDEDATHALQYVVND